MLEPPARDPAILDPTFDPAADVPCRDPAILDPFEIAEPPIADDILLPATELPALLPAIEEPPVVDSADDPPPVDDIADEPPVDDIAELRELEENTEPILEPPHELPPFEIDEPALELIVLVLLPAPEMALELAVPEMVDPAFDDPLTEELMTDDGTAVLPVFEVILFDMAGAKLPPVVLCGGVTVDVLIVTFSTSTTFDGGGAVG